MSKNLLTAGLLSMGAFLSLQLYIDYKTDADITNRGKKAVIDQVTGYRAKSNAILSALGADELLGLASYTATIGFNAGDRQVYLQNTPVPGGVLKEMKEYGEVQVEYLPENPKTMRFVGHRKAPLYALAFPIAFFFLAFWLRRPGVEKA